MIAWRHFCSGARDIQVEDNQLIVSLSGRRAHRLEVESNDATIELRGIVARRALVDRLDNPSLMAWRRNRTSNLVGFRLDARGRLVGESWIPGAGLTANEFLMYVRGLAQACDLFEFQLTGADKE